RTLTPTPLPTGEGHQSHHATPPPPLRSHPMIRPSALLASVLATTFALLPAAFAKAPGTPATTTATHIDIPTTAGTVHVTLRAANVVHLGYLVDGKSPARAMVLDPALAPD